MTEFATPEWIESVAALAARAEVDDKFDITIEQRIIGAQPAAWHVVIRGGRVEVHAGASSTATLRLTSDRSTAEAIHAGTLSAQRAFLDGALQIGGDIGQLIANRAALDVVAGLLADVT